MIINLGNGSYTVPAGKKLYMTSFTQHNLSLSVYLKLNNDYFQINNNPIIASSGDVVSVDNYSGTGVYHQATVFGYLADENYFADCGGGGSSSSSTIDSSYIDSLVQFYSSGNGVGDGCDIQFPDGISSDIIEGWLYSSTTYTVPTGKTLYITNVSTGPGIDFRVNNKRVFYNNNANEWSNSINVILAPSNSVLSSAATGPNTCTYYGFLVDENVEVINEFLGGFSSYTVPVGKVFYIANTNIFTNGDIRVNNKRIVYANIGTTFANNSNFISVSSGSIITGNTSSLASATVNGYLADEDYFADCGGGGSGGSSSILDSLTIVSMINNITNNNQSIGIGDYYQGGVVGHVFQPGDIDYIVDEVHGYLAYFDDTSIGWGCEGIITGVTNSTVGQGPINTQILDSLCPESNFAAKWCNDLVIGGHNDWFLPNSNELMLLDERVLLSFGINDVSVWTSEETTTGLNGCNGGNTCCYPIDFAYRFSLNVLGVTSITVNRKMPGGGWVGGVNCSGWGQSKVIAFRKF